MDNSSMHSFFLLAADLKIIGTHNLSSKRMQMLSLFLVISLFAKETQFSNKGGKNPILLPVGFLPWGKKIVRNEALVRSQHLDKAPELAGV